MTLTIYNDLEQGSDEWLQARCGILTASVIGQLITPATLKVARNDTSKALIRRLAAERITSHPISIRPNQAMQRGTLLEPFAREAYAEHMGVTVEEVGFMRLDGGTGPLGFSPDGLVGDDGSIEIKCPGPETHIATVLADEVPSENVAQVQTGLFVSGRSWIDFVSYCPGSHTYIKRVEPDERWQQAIMAAVSHAETEILETVYVYERRVEQLELSPAEWFDPFEDPIITV
ncbi:lambda exonuclease family protein [Arthrobacter sp. RCC_34]|uniref:lambda exonuclease family protein n=1 Tax=Arthrobacter sp. RCC_34 TaxID=3239230 RepID=UPI003525D956